MSRWPWTHVWCQCRHGASRSTLCLYCGKERPKVTAVASLDIIVVDFLSALYRSFEYGELSAKTSQTWNLQWGMSVCNACCEYVPIGDATHSYKMRLATLFAWGMSVFFSTTLRLCPYSIHVPYCSKRILTVDFANFTLYKTLSLNLTRIPPNVFRSRFFFSNC